MNTFIDHLNQWGHDCLQFAWPMLWQSSLLIILLFALDHVGRRHVRASFRYALWLVVLVKLCLPPTLALPTSPAWWLHRTPPHVAPSVAHQYTVSYDQEPPPVVAPTMAPVLAPSPAMTKAAWLLAASSMVSLVLLFWLLVRWAQITRRVRLAATCERLAALTRETQSMLGLKSPIQVKLTANSMSPAVCGLFRPAILIPISLADHFSDDQLRAVLLHELIHVRRRDVWVNFLQALLQIVYWWHPLVWLANARLRRVREEAVDDAVVLALRDGAEDYAPTLLAVAKLALNRPLVSLGLVGIMESRHALRQRIERLLDARTPRRPRLTLASLLGILAFSAVAVPMGNAPVQPVEASVVGGSPRQAVMITAELYAMPKTYASIFATGHDLLNDPKVQPIVGTFTDEQLAALKLQMGADGLRPFSRPRIETGDSMEASLCMGDATNGVTFACRPQVVADGVRLSFRAEIAGTGVDNLRSLAGTVLAMTNVMVAKGSHLATFSPPAVLSEQKRLVLIISVQELTNNAPAKTSQPSSVKPRDKSIDEVMTPVPPTQPSATAASHPAVDEAAVEPLIQRTFKVLPNLPTQPRGQLINRTELDSAIHDALNSLGTVRKPPMQIFYDDVGGLFVKARQQDMAIITNNLGRGFHSPPQVHIKSTFLQVPKGSWNNNSGFSPTSFGGGAGLVGILTKDNYQTALHHFERQGGVVTLGQPEGTTSSGRQMEMLTTTISTVVTNITGPTGPNAFQPQTSNVETGPVLDAVAHVLPDGCTIALNAAAGLIESFGVDVHHPGRLPYPPTSASLRLWDGQTLIFGKIGKYICVGGKKVDTEPACPGQKPWERPGDYDKDTLVFVTVTLVDTAGNRVHSDDELAFAKDAIPPQ